jgi:hypothetical protein
MSVLICSSRNGVLGRSLGLQKHVEDGVTEENRGGEYPLPMPVLTANNPSRRKNDIKDITLTDESTCDKRMLSLC